MDHMAATLGVAPEVFRQSNLYQKGQVTPYGQTLTYCSLPALWEQATTDNDFATRKQVARTWRSIPPSPPPPPFPHASCPFPSESAAVVQYDAFADPQRSFCATRTRHLPPTQPGCGCVQPGQPLEEAWDRHPRQQVSITGQVRVDALSAPHSRGEWQNPRLQVCVRTRANIFGPILIPASPLKSKVRPRLGGGLLQPLLGYLGHRRHRDCDARRLRKRPGN